MAVAVLAACRLDPFRAPGPLEGLPAAPLVAPVYEDPTRSDHYAPTGLLPDGDGLWVWSSEHPLQTRLSRGADGRLAVTARRTGPLGTRRCVAGGGRLPDTVCVGRDEPGGLVWWGGDFAPALPRRGGFADLATASEGTVWVLDPVERVVWTLDDRGSVVARAAVPESAYRMGRLGADLLWVLSGTEPRLAVLSASGSLIGVPLVAPQRDAVWDERRGLLWTVGPEDRVVRRSGGPLVGAGSALVGRPIEGLLRGDPRPTAVLPLAPLGAVDATAVALAGDVLAVAATGSDHLLLARWAGSEIPVTPGEGWDEPRSGDTSHGERGSTSSFTTALLDGGLAPWAVAAVDGGVAVVSRLDDAARIVEVGGEGAKGHLVGGAARTVVLDDTPRGGAVDLGERLFYGALLWERRPGSDVTCNTCHWEGGTDHRLHPGFREERWEITRPLWGMGAMAPVFSAGHAPTLEDSVEGLVRTLDPRLWEPARSEWWLDGREVRVKEGVARLDAAGVRLALLAWLRSRPVPRAPLRAPGEPLSTLAEAGRALFLRDCAACHRAAPTMSGGAAESAGPLVHGAALFTPVGVAPPFTPDGTRVSPLLHPARGGPWFTNGAATTLEDVLRGFRPGAPHAGPGAPGPGYTDDEVGALRAWLLSI